MLCSLKYCVKQIYQNIIAFLSFFGVCITHVQGMPPEVFTFFESLKQLTIVLIIAYSSNKYVTTIIPAKFQSAPQVRLFTPAE